jgi:hypothetical protein
MAVSSIKMLKIMGTNPLSHLIKIGVRFNILCKPSMDKNTAQVFCSALCISFYSTHGIKINGVLPHSFALCFYFHNIIAEGRRYLDCLSDN